MNLLCFLSILTLLLIQCKSQNSKDHEEGIPVEINNTAYIKFNFDTIPYFNILYNDKNNDLIQSNILPNNKELTIEVDSIASFSIANPIIRPMLYLVYLNPNDSIQVNYVNDKIEMQPLNSQKSYDELNLYIKYEESKTDNSKYSQLVNQKKNLYSTKNIKSIYEINQKIYQLREDFIQEYSKTRTLSDNYKSTFLNAYRFTKFKLDYWDFNKLKNTENQKLIVDSLVQLLNKVWLTKEMTNDALSIFSNFKNSEENKSNTLIKFSKKTYDFLDNNFNGRTRDILMYNLFKTQDNNPSVTEAFNTFKNKSQNTEIINLIQQRLNANSKAYELQSALLKSYEGNEITLEHLINKYNGKTIYIDFWASWCAPCRAAFPLSHKLQEKYKEVVFIYISIDEDSQKWEEACSKEKLVNENSFYMINYKYSEFVQRLNINSIPRYLIIDKEGKLANQNAPGPGAENIEEILDAYLR